MRNFCNDLTIIPVMLYPSAILASEACRIAFTAGAIMPNYWVFYGAQVAADILHLTLLCKLLRESDTSLKGSPKKYVGYSLLGDLLSLICIAGYPDHHDGTSLQLFLQMAHIPAMIYLIKQCCVLVNEEVVPFIRCFQSDKFCASLTPSVTIATPAITGAAASHAISITAERSQPVQAQSNAI